MRNTTRGVLALALILLAASAGTGTTTAVPQSANAERLPSDSYPQWSPPVYGPAYGRGSLDEAGTFHTVNFSSTGGWGAAVVNDNFHSRKFNGVNTPAAFEMLPVGPAAWEFGPDRTLHAVWVENETIIDEYGTANSGGKLIYRNLKDGIWSSPRTIIPAVLRRFVDGPVIGLCLYDRRRMPLKVIGGALATHPVAGSRGHYSANPFYDRGASSLAAVDDRNVLERLAQLDRS